MKQNELTFTTEQEERRSEIHDLTLNYCRELIGNGDLELADETLGDISEVVSTILADEYHKVYCPAIVYLGNDEYAIKNYIENGDIVSNMDRIIGRLGVYDYDREMSDEE